MVLGHKVLTDKQASSYCVEFPTNCNVIMLPSGFSNKKLLRFTNYLRNSDQCEPIEPSLFGARRLFQKWALGAVAESVLPRWPCVWEIGSLVPGQVKPMTYQIDTCCFLA